MKIRLNSILILIVLVVLTIFFFAEKSGSFLNGSEAQIYLLMAIALVSLVANARLNNEFLEILNLIFVVFYICRIPFVLSNEMFSDVTAKNVDVSNIPWYILILAIQYLSLVICIFIIDPRIQRKRIGILSASIFKKLMLFSLFIISANIVMVVLWFDPHISVLSHIPAILKTIFTLDNALMLIILGLATAERKTIGRYKFGIACCFLLFIGIYIYMGIKSGLLQIILLGFLVMVVVYGPLVFRLRSLVITISLGFASIVVFYVGAVFRSLQYGHQMQEINIWSNLYSMFAHTSLSGFIGPVSYRIGYFDFFIEKISNPVYEPYISFTYYFKALADKLTPGFDLFGVPFMSRAIFDAYHGSSSGMNSELVTVFGESYVLLGFFSFVLYLGIMFLIKRALTGFRDSSGIACGLFYLYIVISYYRWLTGSGLDMVISLMVYQGIFVFSTIWLIGFWSRKEEV